MCICDSSSVDREQQRWWCCCCSSTARSSLIFLHDGTALHDPFCLFTKFPHIPPTSSFGSFSRRVPARVALFLSAAEGCKKELLGSPFSWTRRFIERRIVFNFAVALEASLYDSRRMCNSNGGAIKTQSIFQFTRQQIWFKLTLFFYVMIFIAGSLSIVCAHHPRAITSAKKKELSSSPLSLSRICVFIPC